MIFTSTILAGASGSLGGLTASHNRGGQYLRARTIPTNPGTGFQTAVRTIFGNLAARWQTLTPAQREAWTTYAINVPILNALGEPITLTGQQMYIRCNTPRQQAGAAVVDDGPTVFALDSLSTVSIAGAEATGIITTSFDDTDAWVDEDDAHLLIYSGREVAITINFFKGPYRFAGKIDGDGTTPPTSPDATITSPFGLTDANQFYGRALTTRADGRISAAQFIGPAGISA